MMIANWEEADSGWRRRGIFSLAGAVPRVTRAGSPREWGSCDGGDGAREVCHNDIQGREERECTLLATRYREASASAIGDGSPVSRLPGFGFSLQSAGSRVGCARVKTPRPQIKAPGA